jgi:hypothetical protein
MIITFDPDADAVYVKLPERDVPGGQTEVNDDGLVVDTYSDGEARGYEFLSVGNRGLEYASLPAEVAHAIGAFVRAGHLRSTTYVEISM